MYQVSQAFLDAIYEPIINVDGGIKIADNENILTTKKVDVGYATNQESSLYVGSCCCSTCEAEFFSDDLSDAELVGIEVTPIFGVLLPDQSYESIPMGKFIVSESKRINSKTISISAYDKMTLFDIPYDPDGIEFPCTLKQLLQEICSRVGVTLATQEFPNSEYELTEQMLIETSYRNMLSHIAQVAGAFARMNRDGELELAWYQDNQFTMPINGKMSETVAEYSVPGIDKLTIKVEENDLGVSIGDGEHEYSIINNPLLYANPAEALQGIFDAIKDMPYTPIELKCVGNPAIDAGDYASIVMDDESVVSFPVMQHSFYFSGGFSSTYRATGISEADNRPKGTINEKIIALNRRTNVLTRTLDENTLTLNSITTELGETIDRTNQIEQTVDSLGVTVSRAGGSNLVKNSSGLFGTDSWETNGDITVLADVDVLEKTTSKSSFVLGEGDMRQELQLKVDALHTASFLYRKNASIVIVEVAGYDIEIPPEEVTEWTKVIYQFTPQEASTEVFISCNSAYFQIADLMVAEGEREIYSQHPDEIVSASVRINETRGLVVSLDSSDSETQILDGIRVVNKATGEVIITNDTTQTIVSNLHSRGQISANKTRMIPLDDSNAFMIVIND